MYGIKIILMFACVAGFVALKTWNSLFVCLSGILWGVRFIVLEALLPRHRVRGEVEEHGANHLQPLGGARGADDLRKQRISNVNTTVFLLPIYSLMRITCTTMSLQSLQTVSSDPSSLSLSLEDIRLRRRFLK